MPYLEYAILRAGRLDGRIPQETGDLAEAGRELARIAEEFELNNTDLEFLRPFIPRLDDIEPVASGWESR